MSSCRSRAFHRTAYCVLTVCVSPGGKRNPQRRRQLDDCSRLRNEVVHSSVEVSRAQATEVVGALFKRSPNLTSVDRWMLPNIQNVLLTLFIGS